MLSPAQVIAPGGRTEESRLGLDAPVGERISAEDYAVALVDEIEKPSHRRQRFTVGY
jgi:putative NADH-flavin reductase